MRLFALTCSRQLNKIDQHIGEAIAGHGAVGTALDFKVQKQTAIATENGNLTHLAFVLPIAQGRDFFQTGPILVFEHQARGVVVDDAFITLGAMTTEKVSG
jgi:hypothetical protein